MDRSELQRDRQAPSTHTKRRASLLNLIAAFAIVATLVVLLPAVSEAEASGGESKLAPPAANRLLASSPGEPSITDQLRAAYWRGRVCTTATCKSPPPGGGLAEVTSFGLAAFGGVYLSRRRAS